MCHAAQWLIDGNVKPHHGAVFKKWAKRAMAVIGDVTVTTTHNYEIQYKYAWACTNTDKCGVVIKRQSRSVDVTKQCCGRCKSRLEEINVPDRGGIIDRTPKKKRTASNYNIFIQQNSA